MAEKPTWHSDGPFLALQSCTGQRGFTHTCHVHGAHLELVEDVLLQVLGLKETNVDNEKLLKYWFWAGKLK